MDIRHGRAEKCTSHFLLVPTKSFTGKKLVDSVAKMYSHVFTFAHMPSDVQYHN